MEGIWGNTVFAKESEAGHLPAGDLPPGYDSRSTWELALVVRPLEAEQRLYPDQPITTSPPTAHDGSTHPNYNSANSSALQVTTARGAYGRVVISYLRYDEDDLSERLPVIDDTSTMTT